MKKNIPSLILASLLAMFGTGCHNNRDTQSDPETANAATPFPMTCDNGHTLYAIQDCPQTMPADLFRGLDDTLLAQLLPDGTAEASINVFLLTHDDHTVLFDAGMGATHGGQLLSVLDSLGFKPTDISDVCITHLHFDHIGGLLDANGAATFPQAVLHIAQAEYDGWMTGAMSRDNGQVQQMVQAYKSRITLFNPGDTLLGDIVTVPAPGHTPGHTVYDLGCALVVGDILHAVALQVEHPEFCARFDYAPEQAVASRRAILDRARHDHTPLLGMHFPLPMMLEL